MKKEDKTKETNYNTIQNNKMTIKIYKYENDKTNTNRK